MLNNILLSNIKSSSQKIDLSYKNKNDLDISKIKSYLIELLSLPVPPNKLFLLTTNQKEILNNKELIDYITYQKSDQKEIYFEIIPDTPYNDDNLEKSIIKNNILDNSFSVLSAQSDNQSEYEDCLYSNNSLLYNQIQSSAKAKANILIKKYPYLFKYLLKNHEILSYINDLTNYNIKILDQIGVQVFVYCCEYNYLNKKYEKSSLMTLHSNSNKVIYLSIINKGLLSITDFNIIVNFPENSNHDLKIKLKIPSSSCNIIIPSKGEMKVKLILSIGNIKIDQKIEILFKILFKNHEQMYFDTNNCVQQLNLIRQEEDISSVLDFIKRHSYSKEILDSSHNQILLIFQLFINSNDDSSIDDIYFRLLKSDWNLDLV